MASSNGGVLIFFDEPQRQELIHERADGGSWSFSDTLSSLDWKFRSLDVCLLSFSGASIDYIGLVRRGKTVATAKIRVEFSELVPLGVDIAKVEALLNKSILRYFIRTSRGTGGKISPKTWNSIIEAIKKLRPRLANEMDRVIALRNLSQYKLTGRLSNVLLQERDALGSALDIFSGDNKLRQKVLGSWAPTADSVKNQNEQELEATYEPTSDALSFLSGLDRRYQEESALQHDLFNWPRMTPIHVSGTTRFEQGSRVLEVIYANRNALEHTLGVDLIYFQKEYELFALVQYKVMSTEKDRVVFRPNVQLAKEIQRMDHFIDKYRLDTEIESHKEFRLNADGFFIKLVPDVGLRAGSGDLVKGMYLTREYLKFLLGPNGPRGEKGGIVIDYRNSPRYLTTSEFTRAINRGWLGMQRLHTKALKDLIRHYYETGEAVLLAYEKLTTTASVSEELTLF
jgi:hypothetical protein